jgi:hypothetical protein
MPGNGLGISSPHENFSCDCSNINFFKELNKRFLTPILHYKIDSKSGPALPKPQAGQGLTFYVVQN